ncbi:MAG: hypothetical protein NDJ19_11135 [Ramlibacter sp.]|nr:hypothetical protein [Ramlibacter sp.]
MKTVLVSSVLASACALSLAKLPPPDEAAKAKAAETTAKAAWQAKVDGYQLCKVQDKIAAQYMKTAARKPAAAAAPAPATPPAAAASASAAPATAAAPAQPAASGTPVAAKPPPPCIDPGPFAYNPPEQKPLETAGAHSPSGTAASPPSVKPNSAEMAPAKK